MHLYEYLSFTYPSSSVGHVQWYSLSVRIMDHVYFGLMGLHII